MPAYPKDFFDWWQGDVDIDLCFGIMPFDENFNPVWEAIKATVQEDPFNISCVRSDEVAEPGCIIENVLEYIARARLVIADLTGRNPNVFYELGIAHTCKPSSHVVLLAQTIDDVPFDLRHLRCLVYKPDLSNLSSMLSNTLSQGAIRRYSVEVTEGGRARFPARVTGVDRCLYDVETLADYLGDDGVKLRFVNTRYIAGREPEVGQPSDSYYLGTEQPVLKLQELGWTLRYGEGSRESLTIFLERQERPNSGQA